MYICLGYVKYYFLYVCMYVCMYILVEYFSMYGVREYLQSRGIITTNNIQNITFKFNTTHTQKSLDYTNIAIQNFKNILYIDNNIC